MSLEELSKKHVSWIKMATDISNDAEKAKDMVQDMYLKLHDCTKEISASYVWFTLRSIFINEIRKKKEDAHDIDFFKNEMQNDNDIFEFVEKHIEHQSAIEVFESLPVHERIMIAYSYTEGLRKFSRGSKISANTVLLIRKKYKQKIWEHVNQKKSRDSETLLNELQALWESNHAKGATAEKTGSTLCFLSTAFGS